MADYPFSTDERKFLESLLKNQVRFILVGLSAAALQGAPVVTQDIDLWFENFGENFRTALKEAGVTYIPPDGTHPPLLAGDGTQLFDIVVYMHGLGTFAEEMRNTIRLPFGDGFLQVLKLERIIESKRALGRPRDKLVLPLLEDALAVLRDRDRENGGDTPPRESP